MVKIPETHAHKKCKKIAKTMNQPLFAYEYETTCRWCGKEKRLILKPRQNRYICTACGKTGNLDDLLELVERETYGVNYPLMSEMKGVNQ